jgi:hypothetical protein
MKSGLRSITIAFYIAGAYMPAHARDPNIGKAFFECMVEKTLKGACSHPSDNDGANASMFLLESCSAEWNATNELRFTARQSRVSALAEGQVDAQTIVSAYGELDFWTPWKHPDPD